MIKRMIKKTKNRKGFTIIEMVIVLAIIGVLLLFIMPTFGTAKEKAQGVAFEMARKRLYEAATMFTMDFPNTEATWASHMGGEKAVKGKEITSGNLHEAWFLYLDEFPQNPLGQEGDTFTVHIYANGDIEITP